MKIISNTGDNRETCKTCGTIYEYENTDLRFEGMDCLSVECPVCGQKVYIVNCVETKKIDEPITIGDENEKRENNK